MLVGVTDRIAQVTKGCQSSLPRVHRRSGDNAPVGTSHHDRQLLKHREQTVTLMIAKAVSTDLGLLATGEAAC